jgi:hypothetical protein
MASSVLLGHDNSIRVQMDAINRRLTMSSFSYTGWVHTNGFASVHLLNLPCGIRKDGLQNERREFVLGTTPKKPPNHVVKP